MVAREVTLLPRHWDWLATQPGGASVALRKLVEEARSNPRMLMRGARDSVYRFATALVGNAPGYEEAMRALYAGEREDFMAHIEAWPPDIRAKLEDMADSLFLKVADQAFFLPIAIAGGFKALWDRRVPAAGDAAFPRRAGPRLPHWRAWRLRQCGRRFRLLTSFAILLDHKCGRAYITSGTARE